jgi:nicotinamidase-related amidase
MKSFLIRFLLIFILLVIIMITYHSYLKKQEQIISTGEPIPEYDSLKSTLLVIDLQEASTGRMTESEEYSPESNQYIAKVNQIIKHSANQNITVIYICAITDNWLLNLLNDRMKKGTIGTRLDSRLVKVSDYLLQKNKWDSFSNPELDAILKKERVSRLYIVGLDVAYCIKNTIFAALNRGYEVYAIKDALRSGDQVLRKQVMQEFKTKGVKVITSSEFLDNPS